ncbi:MAG: shikimate kinase [Pirellulales bacterium]
MNISLIGYRGTGKSTVAQQLALRLGWNWIDSDVEVELAAAKPIAAIFKDDGESAFRDQETAVIQHLATLDQQVFALGGGAVLRSQNRQLITAAGHVVWLRASPKVLHQRLSEDPVTRSQRPNLTTDGGFQEIVNVLAEREALYRECADIEVDTEGRDVAAVVTHILSQLDFAPTSQ